LTVALDHELVASISALQALATSEHLETGDLKSFHDQARRVLNVHQSWSTINVFDRSGQQVIDLLRPFGSPSPAFRNRELVRATLESGQPAISDIVVGPVADAPIIGISLPVMRGGNLLYVLGARLDVRSVSRLLSEGAVPRDWVATVIDRKGNIVARTRGIEQWLAKPASPTFVAQSQRSVEGTFRDVTIDGVSVYAAFRRSRVSEWTVGLGVPAVVNRPGQIALGAIGGAGVLVLLIAGALATMVGRRIGQAILMNPSLCRRFRRGPAQLACRYDCPNLLPDLDCDAQSTAREQLHRMRIAINRHPN
jgi:hypothetical protein